MVLSRANLEKTLFEEPGYKTLVTIRDGSTIPSNNGTRLYQFRLVRENDAHSLFCFWALGQISIPTISVANLVKEFQSEWKGLLLALNGVIGSSLHGEPLVTWKSARKKLFKEFLSNCHTGRLLRCLETSIDLLDDVPNGWLSDLARFPDEKKNCEDAPFDIWVYIQKLKRQDTLFNLRDNPGSRAAISYASASELYFSQKYVMRDAPLEIWVYIQKLKRQNALAMVLELTLKNLFNLRDNPGSRAATSYGSASKLYFSQQDVMRDLALYLRCQRLIMLRKKHSLQGKHFMLKFVSVHTGPINETQCFEMNFSKTQALVYSTTVLKDERLRFS